VIGITDITWGWFERASSARHKKWFNHEFRRGRYLTQVDVLDTYLMLPTTFPALYFNSGGCASNTKEKKLLHMNSELSSKSQKPA
jgi:hypothetical protein